MITEDQRHVLDRLSPLAKVSNIDLREQVYTRGKCLGTYTPPATPAHEDLDPFFPPAKTKDAEKRIRDRVRAAQECAGCPVRLACLELELRVGGQDSAGTWGGVCERDRQELYPAWLADRGRADSMEVAS